MPDDNAKANNDAPPMPATGKDGSEPQHRLVISPASERIRQAIGGRIITFGFQRWPSNPEAPEQADEQPKDTTSDEKAKPGE